MTGAQTSLLEVTYFPLYWLYPPVQSPQFPLVATTMEQEPSEGQVKELQAFMETENQKAVIQAAISKLTDICFEKCITKPGNKLDSSEANCVANCAGRFLDSSVFVVNRMMATAQATPWPSVARGLARPRATAAAAPKGRTAALTPHKRSPRSPRSYSRACAAPPIRQRTSASLLCLHHAFYAPIHAYSTPTTRLPH